MKESCYEYKKSAFDYIKNCSGPGAQILRSNVINFLRVKFKSGTSKINISIVDSVNALLKSLLDSGYIIRVSRGKYASVSNIEINFVEFYNKYIYGHRF